MAAVRKDVHGPLAEGPTCFNRLMAGVAVFTRTSADAVLPVPPFVEVTLPVTLFFNPVVAPVTVTLKVQFPFAAIVPPVNAIVLEAAVVVKLFVPPQALKVPSAMVKPSGKTSVTATPVKAVEVFGFVMVKFNVVVLPVKMGLAVNDFEMTGGATTVREA